MTDITFAFDFMTYFPGVYFLVLFLSGKWSPLDSMFFSFWICWWFVILADMILPPRMATPEEQAEMDKVWEAMRKRSENAEICEYSDKEESP